MKKIFLLTTLMLGGLFFRLAPLEAAKPIHLPVDNNATPFEEAITAAGLDVVSHNFSDASKIVVAEPQCAYINITGADQMPQRKNDPQNVWMEVYLGQGNYFRKRAIIDAQGNSSMAFEKKNFKADFCDDEWIGDDTPDITIGDWVKHDSFHFKAYYTDWLRGADAVALDFYDQIAMTSGYPWTRALSHISKPKANARCYPGSFPCIVYLNGEFYGIFAWQQKKHRDNMNQQKSVATHIHLDGNLRNDTFWKGDSIMWTEFEVRNPKDLYCMDGTPYDGDHPQELIDESSPYFNDGDDVVRFNKARTAQVKHYIERFHAMESKLQAMAQQSDDEGVRQLFETYIDLTSLVDYACHHHVTANIDGFGKNWQWFTYDGEKWFVAPYDVDCTFGNHFSGNFICDAQYTGTGDDLAALYPTGPFYWLKTYYENEIKMRYHGLRHQQIISTHNICSLIDNWYNRVGADNYSAEWNRWPDSKCISSTITNDGWKQSDWTDYHHLPTWNATTAYAVGERVKLNYLVWEATKPSVGVKPWVRLGYTDDLERYKAWVEKRITLLDKHFGFSEAIASVPKAYVGDVFKAGDLWYRVVDKPFLEGGTVEVCNAQEGETYTGEIVIPEMIQLEDGITTFVVVNIGSEAFKGCRDLTIHVPGSVKRIVSNAFSNCSGITLVIDDLSSWCKMECGVWRSSSRFFEDEPFMPDVDWLVVDGKKLTSLEVPADVTTLGNVFRGYRNLESVNLPASVSLGSKSFQGCTGLRSVYVHREAPYPIHSMLFEGVNRSCTLYVPKGLREDFIECGWTENVFLGGVVETDEVPEPTGVGITKLHFPDKEFRSYLRSMDEGKDGIFTEEEIASIKRFNPTNKKIESLEGIGAFTSLEELICYENNLSRLDLPKSLPLKQLNVSSCPLQSIDVSAYSSLEVLYCSDCGLSSLDLSKNPNLKTLSCSKNQLTSLNLSNNPLLGRLRCEENQLTSLDLSHCPKLTSLYCQDNRLTELNIDGCRNLNNIFCYNNQLKRLDVSQCAILWEIDCSNNAITSLDFPRAIELKLFNCSTNQLKSLDLSNCIALEELLCNDNQLAELLLPLSPVKTIECAHNQLEQLDASGSRQLATLLCDHNQLKSIHVSGCDRLWQLRCNNNLMKDDGMDKLIAGLPLRYGGPYFDVINQAGDGNSLTSAQLQAIRDKGWTPRKCNSDMSGWTTIIDMNDITAIASPELQQEVQHGAIYNLQGQRRMSLQKGLNIVNGKKIMK